MFWQHPFSLLQPLHDFSRKNCFILFKLSRFPLSSKDYWVHYNETKRQGTVLIFLSCLIKRFFLFVIFSHFFSGNWNRSIYVVLSGMVLLDITHLQQEQPQTKTAVKNRCRSLHTHQMWHIAALSVFAAVGKDKYVHNHAWSLYKVYSVCMCIPHTLPTFCAICLLYILYYTFLFLLLSM